MCAHFGSEGFDRMIRTNLFTVFKESCIVLTSRFRLDIDLSAEDHPLQVVSDVTETIRKEVNKYMV